MKKELTLITLFTLLFVSFSYSQITTTKVKETPVKTSISAYDSTKNYLGDDAIKYIGQELYVKGLKNASKKDGYLGFYSDINSKKTYKPNFRYSPFTPTDTLLGKYFKVLDVKNVGDNYRKKFHFTLQEKETGEILYYEYLAEYTSSSFPFIVVGFFEKYKKDYIGKEFIFPYTFFQGSEDFETGKKITNRLGQKWKCIDITVDEVNFELNLVYQNSLGEKVLHSIINNFKDYFVGFTTQEANRYIAKFGKVNFNMILQGNVSIGMTKEMCELSWGKPKSINTSVSKSVTIEQWVYSDNYLYFRNGRLSNIQ